MADDEKESGADAEGTSPDRAGEPHEPSWDDFLPMPEPGSLIIVGGFPPEYVERHRTRHQDTARDRPRGDMAPVLDDEDERILDGIWDRIGHERREARPKARRQAEGCQPGSPDEAEPPTSGD